jgi:hypothetical protein
LGVENLQILEKVDIHSIPALSTEDPEKLYKKIEQVSQGGIPPLKAKIRIWVREAQKRVKSYKL